MRIKTNQLLMALFLLLVISCRKDNDILPDTTQDLPYNPSKDQIIVAKKEIRAAWIATVSNLDWPSTKSNAEAQKSELILLLDRLQTLNFNAVILQVRPNADAFYASALEPWSIFLTGTQGTDPGYDPLQFAIEEAHKRGMELHAWLNPYRIGAATTELAVNHVALKHPEWVVVYGGVRYFNPGIPEVQAHLVAVVQDIVTRYAVDAIHFDDYFYPSGAKSTTDPFGFNDKDAFMKYGNGLDVHAWRAQNINTMVGKVAQSVHQTKPGVLFGISPSGRRENSLDLYADPLIWLQNRWVDYLAPQIYWEFGHATADFGQLAAYWNNYASGTPMIIGIATYKYKDPAYPAFGNVSQFDRQIEEVRKDANFSGCFFFRAKFLLDAELLAFLQSKYNFKSVLPFMGISDKPAPAIPVVTPMGTLLRWNAQGVGTRYVVYKLTREKSRLNTVSAKAQEISSKNSFEGEPGKSYFVTAINEDNVESGRSPVFTLN